MTVNILIFFYTFTAIIFFEDSDLVIVPKIFAGLLIAYHMFSLASRKSRLVASSSFLPLCYFSLAALISYSIADYSIEFASVNNIILILFLSVVIYNTCLQSPRSYQVILVAISTALCYNFIRNIFFPELDQFDQVGRFNGTLGNANFFALVINLAIALFIRNYKDYSVRLKSAVVAFIVLSSYQILMSGSKMGMFLYVTNIIFFILFASKVNLLKFTAFVVVALIALTYLPSFIQKQDSYVIDRLFYFTNVITGQSALSESDEVRVAVAKKAYDLWKAKPFFGWGYGAFVKIGGYNLYSHNNILELLCNLGIVGFAVFHLALYNMVSAAYTKHEKRDLIWCIYFTSIILLSSIGIVLLSEKIFWLIYFATLANLTVKKNPAAVGILPQFNNYNPFKGQRPVSRLN